MADAGVTVDMGWKARADAARARFKAEGVNMSEWARSHGFKPKLVHLILKGDRPCHFGDSHRIAVALGIKHTAARALSDAA